MFVRNLCRFGHCDLLPLSSHLATIHTRILGDFDRFFGNKICEVSLGALKKGDAALSRQGSKTDLLSDPTEIVEFKKILRGALSCPTGCKNLGIDRASHIGRISIVIS